MVEASVETDNEGTFEESVDIETLANRVEQIKQINTIQLANQWGWITQEKGLPHNESWATVESNS